MTPEELEMQFDAQKGVNTATIGILRFLMIHLAVQQTPEGLQRLNRMLNNMRYDSEATEDLGMCGMETYNQVYDFVEAAMIEVMEQQ